MGGMFIRRFRRLHRLLRADCLRRNAHRERKDRGIESDTPLHSENLRIPPHEVLSDVVRIPPAPESSEDEFISPHRSNKLIHLAQQPYPDGAPDGLSSLDFNIHGDTRLALGFHFWIFDDGFHVPQSISFCRCSGVSKRYCTGNSLGWTKRPS